ncbi:glycosyl transferase family 2 [Maritimibacter sp. 55A14]|nr:glycosyl transferase family 2 [Maritimibacter sp. 55A14]
MMKDEGPYVLEWVAHHLALGFTDLVVYTNDCTDGTDEMLMRLEELGLAHHRVNAIPEGIRPQPSALKYAQVEPVVCNSDWLIVFDADEFLCIKRGEGTIDGLISAVEAEGANGIVVTWRIFGSGGVQDWSRAPVTEQYLHAAPPMWNKGWGVKTLFRFDPDYWKLGIHRPKMKNKHLKTEFPDRVKWLNGSGRPMEEYFKFRGWRSITRTVGYDWVQMNHYAVKSMDSYAIRKFRGNVNFKKDKYNADYWALQDRNEVYDDAILRHAPRRAEIFEALLEDPVLNRLHFAAVERAEARLAEFKRTPDYDELIAGLKAAAKVPITQVEAKPPKPRDPEKIAALMSEVEKKRVGQAKAARQAAAQEAAGVLAEALYVSGEIDLSGDPPLEWFTNHELKLPADARVFTPAGLQAIAEGKFERNHARRLPGLLPEDGRYLEVGAAVGFLAGHLARTRPDVTVTAQEERPALACTAARVWAENGLCMTARHHLAAVPLFHAEDGQHDARGLAELLRNTRPDLLYLGDPRLTPGMVAGALDATGAAPLRIVIAGRLMLEQADEAAAFADALATWGYAAPEEEPLTDARLLERQAGA